MHSDPIEQVDHITLAKERGRERHAIVHCQLCPLSSMTSPVPFRGKSVLNVDAANTGFALLGEAPGKEETARSMPFIGRSGKLMKAMCEDVGFDWEEGVFRLNVVSCWPKRGTGEAVSTRSPSEKEMGSCRGHLLNQLKISGYRHVLLAGGTALDAFRSDLKVSKVHGRVFTWLDRYVVMPIYHPAAILRNRSLKKPTMIDLELWRQVVGGEDAIGVGVSGECVICGDIAEWYDPDSVGYCLFHKGKYEGQWMKERKRWKVLMQELEVERNQGSLFG